ncbi:helix-turn-helix domain-containing protein [Pseudomonas matsuisoli]|uniref:MerR family transcriptional regulator n=1 Tax=Pseudomonas matsuisoli TaxID=1515666 RepID=A0A917UX26_9PSED|nr:helix-turn-helix domain-containing protein [Pseudomonas matsuisoli]GGJ93520.1 MerR family transcriptional regulator [Pseudomonas matsuisoli]
MDIADVANRSGFPASALRFYEEKGLIRSLGRKGERRQFPAEVLNQLALISLGQSVGFSLDEIRRMLGTDGEPEIDRQALLAKADELDATIRQLRAVSKGLRHAAACPEPRHTDCPTFQKLLAEAMPKGGQKKKGVQPFGKTAGD